MDETTQLILDELRGLRDDSKECIERLTRLETTMQTVVGNGKKSRLDLLEEDVKDILNWRLKMVSICTGVSGVVSLIVICFRH